MFMFGINSSNTEGILELIKNNQIGGVILYKKIIPLIVKC